MVFVALIFLFLGIIIKYGKQYNLIAGYNTLPDEEKSNIDIFRLANLVSNALFYMAIIIVMGNLLSLKLQKPNLELYGILIAVSVCVPYLIIEANPDKFIIQKDEEKEL